MSFSDAPFTFTLIALNVIFSLIGFSNEAFFSKAIGWPYYTKREKQYYRFISSGFMHTGWMHLIFNMLTLFFFGPLIENIFKEANLGGNLAYLLLYFGAMVVSDIPSYYKYRDNKGYTTLGASGAISAVLFASIVFNPWAGIVLYGHFTISAVLFAVLYIIFCIQMGKQQYDNTNHDAHLWGALFGAAFTLLLVASFNPSLFENILQELKNPSLLGR